MDTKLPPICDPRIEFIPDPRLALRNSPSSPIAPLTEGTDIDLIIPAEPLPLKFRLFLDDKVIHSLTLCNPFHKISY